MACNKLQGSCQHTAQQINSTFDPLIETNTHVRMRSHCTVPGIVTFENCILRSVMHYDITSDNTGLSVSNTTKHHSTTTQLVTTFSMTKITEWPTVGPTFL
jgi:hypothetical protein